MKIPVRNWYYLFAYAWAKFPAGDEKVVGETECPDLLNLFAKLLIDGIHRLVRRGLDRGYVPVHDLTRSPRGRLLIDEIIKKQTLLRGEVACTYDELIIDVLHNQILKATARVLANSGQLTREYRDELILLGRKLEGVSNIQLSASCFRRVQLSRNNRQYGILMRLCEFVFHSLLPDQHGSGAKFSDILNDEVRMSAVFEDFLKNFYAHEQKHFMVSREKLHWCAEPLSSGAAAFLPVMETDITLRAANRILVCDAKYYKTTLTDYRGGSKVRSAHLYQLFAYLRHSALKYPGMQVDGALIYPSVQSRLLLDYQLPDHRVRVATVDLSRHWPEIHAELISILFEPYGATTKALAA